MCQQRQLSLHNKQPYLHRLHDKISRPQPVVQLLNLLSLLVKFGPLFFAELVERHPEESLTIVRSWMQEGNS